MRRYFSSTVTRFDSVGCAVITGRMRNEASRSRISSAAMPERSGLGQHMGEGAAQIVPPPRALDMPAPAHGGVLLGDGQELEPQALRLESARHQLRREAREIGAAAQHGLDLRLMPAHDLDEEAEQNVGRLLGGCAGDERRREGGDRVVRLLDVILHGKSEHSWAEPISAGPIIAVAARLWAAHRPAAPRRRPRKDKSSACGSGRAR